MGDADAVIGGLSQRYPFMVKPALQVVGSKPDVSKVASMHILTTKSGPLFLADTTAALTSTTNTLAARWIPGTLGLDTEPCWNPVPSHHPLDGKLNRPFGSRLGTSTE